MKNKMFSLEEARSLRPWLHEVSEEAERQLIEIGQKVQDPKERHVRQLRIIQHWAETVAKLGPIPKQPFTVDFDNGDDFYCWEYPEEDIFFRHDYLLGYAGRHPIED